MDGSDLTVVVRSGLYWPNGVALDRENLRIYWIDARRNKLETATYNGQDRRVLVDGGRVGAFHPYGVLFFNGFVFWSNIYNSSVHQARVRNGQLVSQLIIEDSIHRPAQFQIVSDTHPRPGGNEFQAT